MFNCPQCSYETETLNEGYCEDCRQNNQNSLDLHNSGFDRWEKLTNFQKDQEIKFGGYYGNSR